MKILNKLGLKTKVLILFGIIAIASIGNLVVNQQGFVSINESYKGLSEKNLALTSSLEETTIKMLLLRRHEKDFLLRGDDKYLDRHAATSVKLREIISRLKEL
ncbi:MAG: hypothetical protein KC478_05200, partial [Bacteriovoracaceae bacterium]|nr:hypothetical protein [Bacteriovoracaceae bacterium]